MATMQAVEQKQLVNYTVDAGVAIIEMTTRRRTPTPTR